MSKSPENRIQEPFWLLLTTVVAVTAFSLTRTDFAFAGFKAKPVEFLSGILSAGKGKDAPVIQPVLANAPKKARNKFLGGEREKGHMTEFISSAATEYPTDSMGGLIHFFTALEELKAHKRKTVRVAYFGDSMIEGDLITQDFRKMLQDSFGGYGVGFMPVTSITAGFRQTIIHSFSKNWKDYDLNSSDKEHRAGICGHTFVPAWTGAPIDSSNAEAASGSWVKFTAPKQPRLDNFYTVRMFYGPAEGSQFVTVNGRSIALEGQNAVNQLVLNQGAPVKAVSASFACSNPLEVYGFSLESDSGVFVDNFSLRGNSGLPLASISTPVLSGVNQYLGYDLIILQYGVNVVNSKLKDYGWYEKGMQFVVEHFQKCCPNASILIIGSGDKGYKKQGVWTTDPAIPFLVQSQRNLAEKNRCGFWSLYDAMGGFESMATKWASGDTLYANKDYTHFNHRGARRVGNLLFEELIREYRLYKTSMAG
jgi:hypothetical protein